MMVAKKIDNILNFWSFVEYLQPQEIPKVDPEQSVWRIDSDAAFPWRDTRKRRKVEDRLRDRNRGKAKRKAIYLAYCGLFDSEDISLDLGEWHGFSEFDENQRPDRTKRSAALLVKLDQHGVVFDISVSSLPWAMGRLKPGALPKYQQFHGDDGFEAVVREKLLDCVSDIEVDLERGDEKRVFHEFTFEHFTDLSEIVWSASSWSPRKSTRETFIAAKFVPESSEKIEDDLLNSFLVQDLFHVGRKISEGDVGRGLDQYLSDPKGLGVPRRDILSDSSEILDGLSINRLPTSRWPSSHGLAAAQQYAVNRSLDLLQNRGGIFSVNGPPGTGKTTLLKDIVADVVTRRAEILATFSHPREAFKESFSLAAFNGRKLDPRLLDHLIVVSSSNNPAIENVTKELPAEKSIDVQGLQIDFFKSISDHLLSRDANAQEGGNDEVTDFVDDTIGSAQTSVSTWGLISAALGNSDNRSKFVNRFWFGDMDHDGSRPPRSMQAYLNSDALPPDWSVARRDFLAARQAVEDELKKLSSIEEAVARLFFVQDELRDSASRIEEIDSSLKLNTKLANASQIQTDAAIAARLVLAEQDEQWSAYERSSAALEKSKTKLQQLMSAIQDSKGGPLQLDELATQLNQCKRQYDLSLATKPHAVLAFFRPSMMRSWKDRCESILRRLDRLEIAHQSKLKHDQLLNVAVPKPDTDGDACKVRGDLKRAVDLVKQLVSKTESLKNTVLADVKKSSATRLRIRQLDGEVGHLLKKLQSFGINRDEVETLSSSTFENFHRNVPLLASRVLVSRHRLFVAALELHKSFIGNAKFEVRANLRLICDYLKGAAAPNSTAMPHLWNTLGLCIPVVSTTFASFPRLFKCMDRESLGWLLLDESGQATPQAAVGAIWRSKRAIIVGDPLQLEPVVTLPESSIEILRKKFLLDDEWHPVRRSCQVLADRNNEFGTYIGSDEAQRWVGSPLVVHRRCLNPMFKVANKIAYSDMMIYGTAESKRLPAFDLGASSWINAKPTSGNIGHWIPNQGQIALNMVQHVMKTASLRCEDGSYNVFIITPYRDVARQMVDLLERNGVEDARKLCGTIHTFQGREADTVILLLGGDPQKRNAVGAFAAKTPNLLNVAITRARRRIHVIGDSALWAGARYFSDLYRALDGGK